jgi:hypothetical protein
MSSPGYFLVSFKELQATLLRQGGFLQKRKARQF